MNAFVAIFLACAFNAIIATHDFLPTEDQQKVIDRLQVSEEWELIGQIESKIYFKHAAQDVNWFAARGLCDDEGLEFATFQNSREFLFIVRNTTTSPMGLWTSGKMRGAPLDPSAFIWDTDGGSIENHIEFCRMGGCTTFFPLCIYVQAEVTYVDLCTTGKHQPLCQMQLGVEP